MSGQTLVGIQPSEAHGAVSIAIASEILNVPEDYLARVVQEGALAVDRSSGVAMIDIHELLTWRRAQHKRQLEAMDELVAESQRLGLYD